MQILKLNKMLLETFAKIVYIKKIAHVEYMCYFQKCLIVEILII